MSLREIAGNLGLSVTTVSRALGGHSDVSEATRLRIVREADRIGYVPNEMARRLQKGRADAIGFVIPGGPGTFDDAFFLKIIEGAWARLEEEDIDLLVMSAPSGPQEMKLYKRLVEGRRVDGLILTRVHDQRVNYLLDAQFPFVTISAGRSDDHRVASIDLDNIAAMRMALQRLTDLGHRSIGCVGPRDMLHSSRRLDIFHKLCADMNLNATEIVAEHSIEGGERAVAAILAHHGEITAIVCNTDKIGFGALRELTSRGLAAGRDLSIICFGDSQLTRSVSPRLTILRLPTDQMAMRAVDVLLKLRDGVRVSRLADADAELILNETDGPPIVRPRLFGKKQAV
jgi:LacI family transcriptional regulator